MGRSSRAAALVLALGMVTSVLPAGVELAASPGSTIAPTPTPTPTPSPVSEPTAPDAPSGALPEDAAPASSASAEPAEAAAPLASPEPGPDDSGAAATQARRLDTPSAEEPKIAASLWMTTSSSWVRFGRSVTVSGRIRAGEQDIVAAPVRIVGLSARTGR